MSKKAFAIIVGGGPAPGINGVISAVTIEAIKRGYKVFGINKGFERIANNEHDAITELKETDVIKIHREGGSILGTSRSNPKKDKKLLNNIVSTLKKHNIAFLVTIGGDDTATSAEAIAEVANGEITVGHVPKTIDNDLPLPNTLSTFGFQSAREVGTEIVETLMTDAQTTNRWYLVVAMGRKAGHLALGIGISSGATLTLIPEAFEEGVNIKAYTDIICGSIIKRLANGYSYGVAVCAEGLAEKLNVDSLPELKNAERDPHGNIRFSEVDFGRLLKIAVRRRLEELGADVKVLDKNVGYELRCRPPNAFDREYTRELGFGVVDFLLNGGNKAMITLQNGVFHAIPFTEMMDKITNKARIRLVDTKSMNYKIANSYMTKLTSNDFKNSDRLATLAKHTKLSPTEFVKEFESID